MSGGMIQGGWGYVIAVYAVTWGVLIMATARAVWLARHASTEVG